MAVISVTGVDALLEDLQSLASLPDRVVEDILNAEADVVAQAQREEIQRQWNGPYSMGISAQSIKKDDKMKRDDGGPYINVSPKGTRRRGRKSVRNAEIAFINEYGAPKRGIASRPAILDATTKAEAKAVDAGERVYHAYLDSKNL